MKVGRDRNDDVRRAGIVLLEVRREQACVTEEDSAAETETESGEQRPASSV